MGSGSREVGCRAEGTWTKVGRGRVSGGGEREVCNGNYIQLSPGAPEFHAHALTSSFWIPWQAALLDTA